MLDLRIPTGAFFAIIGAILLTMGVFVPGERAALTESNVNLYCGAVMLVFGGIMLSLARRGAKKGS
jgi:energy-converting hydrogenase Eha subunit E